MRKIRLNPEELHVDSFTTLTSESERVGTVMGQYRLPPAESGMDPCVAYTDNTCYASCNGTCGATCGASCYGTCAGQNTCGASCNVLAYCMPPAQ